MKRFDQMQISFNGSIFGFENLDLFVFEVMEDTPFAYLKSREDSTISFIITSPFYWYEEYSLHLDNSLKNKLEVKREEDILVLSIVTVRENLEESTINLLAPIVINVQTQKGIQHVFHEKTEYLTTAPLLNIGHNKQGGR